MKATTYILIIILGAIPICTMGQDDHSKNDKTQYLIDSAKIENYFQWTNNIEYQKTYNFDSKVLSNNEKKRDTQFLTNFIENNYDIVKLYDEFPFSPAMLIDYLYAIDINGDNLLDIFYQGPTGGEPNITQIFLNKGEKFERIFKEYQDIIQMAFKNNKLTSLTLINPGCCADPQIVEYHYKVSYENSNPIFSLGKTIGYMSMTEQVETKYEKERKFKTLNNETKLRNDCYFFDNIEHPVYGGEGNVIITYKKGSTGKAIGYKKDTDREWIYVLMDSTNEMASCDFPTFLEHPTEIYGWILKTETDLK